MTIKITRAVRAAVRTVIENSAAYDPSTVVIGRSGQVTALKDADKTHAGNDPVRYLVGHVSDMVRPDGSIREGF